MFSKLSLLQRVALAAALPIFVLGLVLQRALEAQVRPRALSNAVSSARLIATLGIDPQLTAGELSSGLSADQIAGSTTLWPAPRRVVNSRGSRSGTARARSSIRTITI